MRSIVPPRYFGKVIQFRRSDGDLKEIGPSVGHCRLSFPENPKVAAILLGVNISTRQHAKWHLMRDRRDIVSKATELKSHHAGAWEAVDNTTFHAPHSIREAMSWGNYHGTRGLHATIRQGLLEIAHSDLFCSRSKLQLVHKYLHSAFIIFSGMRHSLAGLRAALPLLRPTEHFKYKSPSQHTYVLEVALGTMLEVENPWKAIIFTVRSHAVEGGMVRLPDVRSHSLSSAEERNISISPEKNDRDSEHQTNQAHP